MLVSAVFLRGFLVSAVLVASLFARAAALLVAGLRLAPASRSVHLREFVDFEIAHEKEVLSLL